MNGRKWRPENRRRMTNVGHYNASNPHVCSRPELSCNSQKRVYRCRRGKMIHCSVAVSSSDEGRSCSGSGVSSSVARTTRLMTSSTGNTVSQVVTNRFHLLALASLGS